MSTSLRTLAYAVLLTSLTSANAQDFKPRFVKREFLGGDTTPRAVTSFKDGSYAVLCTVNKQGRTDAVICCYAPNGATKWIKTIWAQGSFSSPGLASSPSGDIYAFGQAYDQIWGATRTYFALIAPNGATKIAERLWQGQHSGARDGVVDSNGFLHLTGYAKYSYQSTTSAYSLKIDPSRTYLDYDIDHAHLDVAGQSVEGTNIAINAGSERFIHVGGTVNRLWRIDATKNVLWSRILYNGVRPNDIALGNDGYAYVGGYQEMGYGILAPTVQRFGPTGNLIWTRIFKLPGLTSGSFQKLTFDSQGNLLAAGTVNLTGNSGDYFLTRISPAGAVSYTKAFNSPGSGNDELTQLHVDAWDHAYLTGWRIGSAEALFSLKITPTGLREWMAYSSPGNAHTVHSSIVNPFNGDLLVCAHDPLTTSAAYFSFQQAAVSVADSYVVPKNMLFTSPNSVLANDRYAGDAGVVQVASTAHGTLTLDADGTFTYMPTANYSGPDSFTYRATKPGLSPSTVVTVSLTVQ